MTPDPTPPAASITTTAISVGSATGDLLAPLFKNAYVVAVLAMIDLVAGCVTAAGLTLPDLGLPHRVVAIAAFTALITGQLLKTFNPGMRKTGVGVPTSSVAALLIALVVAIALLAPQKAHASSLTVGPSLPAFAITPGAGHPVTLAAGAGITVGADFFPTTLLEQKVHWLTVGLDAFGSLVPVGSAVGGSASMGLHVCALELFCVGGGVKLLDSGGAGAIDGKLDHRSFFILFEPDCRVMKLLWPAINAPGQADKPIDGDHPNGP